MKNVSLETAKLLKEAGWEPKIGEQTMFHVRLKVNQAFPFEIRPGYINHIDINEERFAAPDVSELLEALPKETTLEKCKYVITQYLVRHPSINPFVKDESPAEALAALWLELRKQGLV